jgi:hypothetical protein
MKTQIKKLVLNPKSSNHERGAAFIPVLIWGGIALVSSAAAWWAGKSAISKATADFISGLLMGVADIIYYISRFLCWTATDIFDTSLRVLDWTIIHNSAFTAGWTSVRDLSNMLIVLGFVIIGIATALRFKNYEATKLLAPLIVMAILINFSGLFVGLIIDGSNLLTKGLISQGGANSAGTVYYNMVVNFANKTFAADTTIYSDPTKYLTATVTVSFIWLTVAATFFYLAIVFIARYAILAFLYVLAPLAFVCKVFPLPAAQKIWNEWWDNFIKWSFVGVGGALVINISAGVMRNIGTTTDPTTGMSSVNITDLMVVLLFLVIGFKMVRKGSAMGAGTVMGLAGGAFGLAMGATGKISKFAAGATGMNRAGEAAKRGATRVGERLGLVAPGTANLMQQEQLKASESEKRGGTWSADQRKDIATGKTGGVAGVAVTARHRNDRVEAIKLMAEKNELGNLSAPEFEKAMAFATSNGVPASVLAEKDYRAAGYGKNGAAAITAKNVQLSESLPKMSGKQLRGIGAPDMHRATNPEIYDILKEQFTPNMAKQFKTADPALKLALKSHIGAVGTADTLEDDIHNIETTITGTADPAEKNRLTKKKDALIKLRDAIAKA